MLKLPLADDRSPATLEALAADDGAGSARRSATEYRAMGDRATRRPMPRRRPRSRSGATVRPNAVPTRPPSPRRIAAECGGLCTPATA